MEYLLDPDVYQKYRGNIVPVPWYGADHDTTADYDVVYDLVEYAALRGWSKSQLTEMCTVEHLTSTKAENIGIIQSMLFFGVWEALTDTRLPSSEYVFESASGGGKELRTMGLRSIFVKMFHRLLNEADNFDYFKSKLQVFKKIQEQLINWVYKLAEYVHMVENTEVQTKVAQIARLGGFSAESIVKFRHNFPPSLKYQLLRSVTDYPIWSGIIVKKLSLYGWCPNMLHRVRKGRMEFLELLLVLGPQEAATGSDHSQCNEAACVANNVNADFKAKHRSVSCNCPYFTLPLQEIERTLRNGKYFLVDMSKFWDGGNPSAALVPYEPGLPYVAISHVWSHGLGGSADQGVPLCQLNRLFQVLPWQHEKPAKYRYIWLDTLCIPLNHDLKMQSISMMEGIYRNAAAVLVLDSGISHLKFHEQHIELIGVELCVCDWNGRLWTFHEKELAKELFVAFEDASISMETILQKLRSTNTPLQFLSRDFLKQSRNWESATLLRAVLSSLRGRQSSDARDEPLVIATLVGKDNTSLTKMTGEDRYCGLWELMERIPSDIIFSGVESRLSKPGFRWAPKSFMTPEHMIRFSAQAPLDARVSRMGLTSQYVALSLGRVLPLPAPIPSGRTARHQIVFSGGRRLLLQPFNKAERLELDTVLFKQAILETGPYSKMYGAAVLKEPDGSYRYQCLCRLVYQPDETFARPGRIQTTAEVDVEFKLEERQILLT
jgi:hypothetical protein